MPTTPHTLARAGARRLEKLEETLELEQNGKAVIKPGLVADLWADIKALEEIEALAVEFNK